MPTCRHCERDFLGTPVELWDGNTYCQECIRRVSEDLHGRQLADQPLSETIEPGEIQLRHFMTNNVARGLAPVTCILLAVVGIGMRNNPDLIIGMGIVLFFFAFGSVWILLVGFFKADDIYAGFPRRVAIERDELCITEPAATKRIKLSDCEWYVGGTSCDVPLTFTRFRRGVLIRTPDGRLACGLSPEMRDA